MSSSGDNFYVTLASNASLERYPNNNGGCYTVHLPEDLHVAADWEVGLSEISFKQDWHSFVKEDLWVRFDPPYEPKTNDALVWHTYLENSSISTKVVELLKGAYVKMKFETEKDGKFIEAPEYKIEIPSLNMYDNLEEILKNIGFAMKQATDKANAHFTKGNTDILYLNTQLAYNMKELRTLHLCFVLEPLKSDIIKPEIIYPKQIVFSNGLGEFLKLFTDTYAKIIVDKTSKVFRDTSGKSITYTFDLPPTSGLSTSTKYKNALNRTFEFTIDSATSPVSLGTDVKSSIKNLFPKTEKFEYPWNSIPTTFNIGKAFYTDKTNIFSSFEKFNNQLVKPLLESALKDIKVENISVIIESVPNETAGKDMNHTKLKISYKGLQPYRLEFSPVLYSILGITRTQLTEGRFLLASGKTFENTVHEIILEKGELEQNVNRGIDSLWVYSDVLKNHIVGHALAPLLRIINVMQSIPRSETRLVTFTHPHYYPVSRHDISEINICIFNSYGTTHIPMRSDTTCTLHFRKQREQKISINYHAGDDEDESSRKRQKYGN